MREIAISEGDEPFWTAAILAQIDVSTAGFDPRRDRILAEIDGQMIGAGSMKSRRTTDGERVYYHSFSVHPQWRGRGISRPVLHFHERRLREMSALHSDDGPRFFQTYPVNDTNTCAGELLVSEGYAPNRFSCRMARSTLDPIPDAPLPAGIEIRPVRPEHERKMWDAKEEAFADLWGFAPASEEAFAKFVEDPNWKRDLTCIAWDGNEVVGTVFVFIGEHDHGSAWTELITVRRPWRKRGIARAIIAECLRRLRAAGVKTAVLSVDTQNPSGAHRVYEGMGYQVTHRATMYRKAMTS